MEWLLKNWGTVLSICSLLVGGIISLYKAFNAININTLDIQELKEDLKKEKAQNKENYNKLQDLIKESIEVAMSPIAKSNLELNKSINNLNQKFNDSINNLNTKLNDVKTDVSIVKNDISSIKDRLSKLEDKAF